MAEQVPHINNAPRAVAVTTLVLTQQLSHKNDPITSWYSPYYDEEIFVYYDQVEERFYVRTKNSDLLWYFTSDDLTDGVEEMIGSCA